ncbi:MAG TPA: hypothetical protein PKD26_01530 [Pyrinomonadaceae bacterium]|nr:hypothetical protein [Pyrinomonadaceae bacterium]
MKGTTVLAVAVCIFCFFIGYLTYLATMFFVDFFKEMAAPCQQTTEMCSQPANTPGQ